MLLVFEGTNVAYTAHIGGFLVGAALVFGTQAFKNNSIDHQYLDPAEVAIDPYLIALQKLYQTIEHCDFRQAWGALKDIKTTYPLTPELLDIEYNLLLALDRSKAFKFLLTKFGSRGLSPHIISAQAKLWHRMEPQERAGIPFQKKIGLASDVLSIGIIELAEKIYTKLESDKHHGQELAVLARKIAMYYHHLGSDKKQSHYNQQAQRLMKVSSTPSIEA